MSEQKTVICPQCGTKNNVKPHSNKQNPICGRCKNSLHQTIANNERRERERLERLRVGVEKPIQKRTDSNNLEHKYNWGEILGYCLVIGSLYLYITLPGYYGTLRPITLSLAFVVGIYLSRSKNKNVVAVKCLAFALYLAVLYQQMKDASVYSGNELLVLFITLAIIVLLYLALWFADKDLGSLYLNLRRHESIGDSIKLYRIRRMEILEARIDYANKVKRARAQVQTNKPKSEDRPPTKDYEPEGDEKFYLIATDEANNAERRDSALWAKAMALRELL
jgi:hypothetical protein